MFVMVTLCCITRIISITASKHPKPVVLPQVKKRCPKPTAFYRHAINVLVLCGKGNISMSVNGFEIAWKSAKGNQKFQPISAWMKNNGCAVKCGWSSDKWELYSSGRLRCGAVSQLLEMNATPFLCHITVGLSKPSDVNKLNVAKNIYFRCTQALQCQISVSIQKPKTSP